MKTCPFCGESIQPAAIKCRYCGEWLDGRSHAPAIDIEALAAAVARRIDPEVGRSPRGLQGSGPSPASEGRGANAAGGATGSQAGSQAGVFGPWRGDQEVHPGIPADDDESGQFALTMRSGGEAETSGDAAVAAGGAAPVVAWHDEDRAPATAPGSDAGSDVLAAAELGEAGSSAWEPPSWLKSGPHGAAGQAPASASGTVPAWADEAASKPAPSPTPWTTHPAHPSVPLAPRAGLNAEARGVAQAATAAPRPSLAGAFSPPRRDASDGAGPMVSAGAAARAPVAAVHPAASVMARDAATGPMAQAGSAQARRPGQTLRMEIDGPPTGARPPMSTAASGATVGFPTGGSIDAPGPITLGYEEERGLETQPMPRMTPALGGPSAIVLPSVGAAPIHGGLASGGHVGAGASAVTFADPPHASAATASAGIGDARVGSSRAPSPGPSGARADEVEVARDRPPASELSTIPPPTKAAALSGGVSPGGEISGTAVAASPPLSGGVASGAQNSAAAGATSRPTMSGLTTGKRASSFEAAFLGDEDEEGEEDGAGLSQIAAAPARSRVALVLAIVAVSALVVGATLVITGVIPLGPRAGGGAAPATSAGTAESTQGQAAASTTAESTSGAQAATTSNNSSEGAAETAGPSSGGEVASAGETTAGTATAGTLTPPETTAGTSDTGAAADTSAGDPPKTDPPKTAPKIGTPADPEAFEAKLDVAKRAYQRGKLKDARAAALEALAMADNEPRTLLVLAQAELELGEFDDAVAHAGVCVEVAPESVDCWLTIAVISQERKDDARALEAWKAYLELAPTGKYAASARSNVKRLQARLGG